MFHCYVDRSTCNVSIRNRDGGSQMKLIVESQTQSDDGIWKPLQIMADPKFNALVSDDLMLFDETDTAKYYINWNDKILVKVTAVENEEVSRGTILE